MIYSDLRVLLIHPPRCGGTSIEKSLLWRHLSLTKKRNMIRIFGLKKTHDFLNRLCVDFKHLNCLQYRQVLGSGRYDEYKKIGVVRNPFDRMVSLYHYVAYNEINFLSGKTFLSFLNNYKPLPWEHGLTCADYMNDEVDFILKIEELTGKVGELEDFVGFKMKIFHHGKTNRSSDYRSYYNADTKQIVSDLYSQDIERFNYSF